MSNTKEQSAAILRQLPPSITTVLGLGTHKGASQFYANWGDGKGKRYRLVVHQASVAEHHPQNCEKWVLHPTHAFNEHVVLCTISRPRD